MKQVIYLLAIFLLSGSKVFGQTDFKCDTIYGFTEIMPQYGKGNTELMNYIINELVPIVGDCIERDKEVIASLRITITINQNGKVIDAIFHKRNTTTTRCNEDIKKKLMTMTGWTAGQIKGQPVCCNFVIPISCLKWSDE